MKPVRASWHNFVAFIPDLLFIIVVIVGARYLIKLLRFFSKELAGERLKIAGFYPDWARPTFNLIRFVIYILVLVITVPYLPFFESKAFRGISIFMGVLLSFGSSTAVSNIIAGLVLTYMRPFVIGDRVKIGETIGDVKEKTLLVTRVRTIKNEDISIPNANILNNHLKNFTKNARDLGIILHTSVTIGYDVSWKKVHELLLSAADKCELAEKEPKPFIFQKSLDDFYVNYELNIHTKQAGKMAFIYSELHKHILDAFNNEGIEILSPHYSALRDGHSLTIPKENVPKDYKKPGFSMGI